MKKTRLEKEKYIQGKITLATEMIHKYSAKAQMARRLARTFKQEEDEFVDQAQRYRQEFELYMEFFLDLKNGKYDE